MADQAKKALSELVREAVRFSYWAAGEGICPVADQPAKAPEDFIMAYSIATDDEDWDGLADKAAAAIVMMADAAATQNAAIERYVSHINRLESLRQEENQSYQAQLRDLRQQIADLEAIERAARAYFNHAVQDEAEDRSCCIDDRQHELAAELRDALFGRDLPERKEG